MKNAQWLSTTQKYLMHDLNVDIVEMREISYFEI